MKLEASSRLRLRDILVLRISGVAPDEEDELATLAGNLSQATQVPIIILREGMTLDSLSEQDMVRAGWVRMERRNNGG